MCTTFLPCSSLFVVVVSCLLLNLLLSRKVLAPTAFLTTADIRQSLLRSRDFFPDRRLGLERLLSGRRGFISGDTDKEAKRQVATEDDDDDEAKQKRRGEARRDDDRRMQTPRQKVRDTEGRGAGCKRGQERQRRRRALALLPHPAQITDSRRRRAPPARFSRTGISNTDPRTFLIPAMYRIASFLFPTSSYRSQVAPGLIHSLCPLSRLALSQ